MLGTLIAVIVYIIVVGLVYWLLDYLLNSFPPPPPLDRVARAFLVVVAVILAIALLLQLAGVASGIKLPGLPG